MDVIDYYCTLEAKTNTPVLVHDKDSKRSPGTMLIEHEQTERTLNEMALTTGVLSKTLRV